jgi:hypothetical protein
MVPGIPTHARLEDALAVQRHEGKIGTGERQGGKTTLPGAPMLLRAPVVSTGVTAIETTGTGTTNIATTDIEIVVAE